MTMTEPPPRPPGARVLVKITLYHNGFTVNDGAFRDNDDPANAPFIKAITDGHVPRELSDECVPPACSPLSPCSPRLASPRLARVASRRG